MDAADSRQSHALQSSSQPMFDNHLHYLQRNAEREVDGLGHAPASCDGRDGVLSCDPSVAVARIESRRSCLLTIEVLCACSD